MNQKWCRGCPHLDFNEMSDEMYCKLKDYEQIRLRWHKHRPDWCPLVTGAERGGRMSVLIKHMAMPKGCIYANDKDQTEYCPLLNHDDVPFCQYIENEPEIAIGIDERPVYCPLSDVPEPCQDTIYRQDAIDAFGLSEKTRKYGGDHSGYDTRMLYEIQDVLEGLPSAQPEQPSEIQDILNYLDTVLHPIISPEHWNVYSELHDMISTLSSAQPERKTGKWVRHYSRPNVYADMCWHCSNCGYKTPDNWANKWKFCPDCGARMVREGEDNERA